MGVRIPEESYILKICGNKVYAVLLEDMNKEERKKQDINSDDTEIAYCCSHENVLVLCTLPDDTAGRHLCGNLGQTAAD
eukprot:10463547-Ditylum_brightwellii.AAC.1